MPGRWTVDSQVFQENAEKLVQKADCFAVVKNNAYNFGLDFAVAQFLQIGIQHFVTTSLNEAIAVRKRAPQATILLTNPTREFDLVKKYHIHLTLTSLDYFYAYQDQLEDLPLQIEYESQLHRSGLKSREEIDQVLAHRDQLDIQGIWTHFGYADDLDGPGDEYSKEREDWLDLLEGLQEDGHQFHYIHAQNSASFFREGGLLPHHTHSRLGIALYGAKPYDDLANDLINQSLTVSASVVQIRQLNQGQYAGYSFNYQAPHQPTQLAIVDIGYGDGLLSARADYPCQIRGKDYPIVGLMMSHLLVEVDDQVQVGDRVYLYSPDPKLRIDYFTHKGVGANSQQLSALNLNSLIKEYD